MSVNNNSSRTIDGQNTLFCDTIEITEEIILNGDNGATNNIIRSDGVNARWAVLSDLMLDLTAGTNISYNAGTTYNGGTARTISATNTEYTAGTGLRLSAGNEFSTDLTNLTAGTNITYSAGSTYNGTTAITINSRDTNTEYTAGTGLRLMAEEFSLEENPSTTKFFPIVQTGNNGLETGQLYYDTLMGLTIA